MAKTVKLAVHVEDQQFQQFMQAFSDLSEKIKNLSGKFKPVTEDIKKTTEQVTMLNKVLQSVPNALKGIDSAAGRVTKQLTKWAALVGSVSMLLGTGAGLFGFERLTNTLTERRKLMMGLGVKTPEEWGKTQAAITQTQSFLSDPEGTLRKIRAGQTGEDMEARRAIVNIAGEKGLKMSPAEVLAEMLRNPRDLFKGVPENFIGKSAKDLGLTALAPGEDWTRIQKFHKEAVERAGRIETAPPGLGPEEAKTWSDMFDAARTFVTQIQTSLGRSLTGIAESLAKVSKGFTDLVQAFMEMPAIQNALKTVREWLERFAAYLQSDEAKKQLEKWSAEMEKIDWAGVGEVIKLFVTHLGTAIRALLALKLGAEGAKVGSALGGPLGGWIGGAGGAAAGYFAPEVLKELWKMMYGQRTPPTFPNNPWTGWPQVAPPAGLPQTDPQTGFSYPPGKQSSIAAPTSFASAIGGSSRMTNIASNIIGGPRITGGSSNFSFPTTSSTRLASWSGAAQRSKPQGGLAINSLMAAFDQRSQSVDNRRMANRGGLDLNNWQSNRTASLRIDNVSGSNLNVIASNMA